MQKSPKGAAKRYQIKPGVYLRSAPLPRSFVYVCIERTTGVIRATNVVMFFRRHLVRLLSIFARLSQLQPQRSNSACARLGQQRHKLLSFPGCFSIRIILSGQPVRSYTVARCRCVPFFCCVCVCRGYLVTSINKPAVFMQNQWDAGTAIMAAARVKFYPVKGIGHNRAILRAR